MRGRNLTVWAAIATGILAVLAVAAALIVPRLAGQPAGEAASPGTPVPSPASAGAVDSGTPTPAASTTAGGAPTPSAAPSPPATSPSVSRAAAALAAMTLEQRVGQIMMVSSPVAGPDGATLDALRRLHVGNVFLKGRTAAGAAAVAGTVGAVRAEATPDSTRGVRPFVATDQEGGQVQILRGPGFSEIPSALAQGAMDPAALRAAAAGWGRELAAVGVNVNFAPVMDTLPSAAFAQQNAPIGRYERGYGYTPESVSTHGVAFAQGLADAGVTAVPKHFPGIGRVTANTDTSAGVADPAATRHDAYIAPFVDAVRAGAPWLMLSNALYPAIDPGNDAVFSPTVIGGMVRGDLGFRGIIVSDDICDAAQISGVPLEQRGARFVGAGGTMVLCTNQQLAPRVWAGMVDRARTDPAFASTVDAAALAVLEAKDRAGLLPQ